MRLSPFGAAPLAVDPILPARWLDGELEPMPFGVAVGGGRRVSGARPLPLSSGGGGLAERGGSGAWGWVKPGIESSSKSSSSVPTDDDPVSV